jgi:hypothetical protein
MKIHAEASLMLNDVQQKLLEGVMFALQPIIKILLQAGIGYREFNELTKDAYIRVATNEFGKRGRPTNISRVAVMTGLSRKEVKRIRDQEAGRDIERVFEPDPCSCILGTWHSDPEFLDNKKLPLVIPYDGDGVSFVALAKKEGGDIPPSALYTELKRVNAIEELDDGRVRVKKLYFVPDGLDEKLAMSIESGLRPLCKTLEYNCNPTRRGRPHFQRLATIDGVDLEKFPEIRKMLHNELVRFSEELGRKLHEYEVPDNQSGETPRSQIGFGAYHFEAKSVPE